jgi:glutathione S-transferase kappa 1
MRFLTAAKQECPELLRPLSEHLWQSHYGQGLEIATEAALSQVLQNAAFDQALITRLIQMTNAPEIKNALRAETEAAVEKGAFGAPTFFIHTPGGEEMFFGSDRFHLVAQVLGQKFP